MGAPVPLTWNSYVTQIGNLAVEPVQTVAGVVEGINPNFTTLLPQAVNIAELRIQRDAQLQNLQTSDGSYSLIAGSNVLAVAPSDFVTVETVSINGSPLLPVSKEWLQSVWGTNANSAQPQFIAPYGGDQATAGVTATNFIVGPWPDSNYPLVITGTQRAPSLYTFAAAGDADTETTLISAWLPDLLIAASMVVVSAFQRNFSSAASDPQMPMNWEAQYQTLLGGAAVEEAKKRFAAQGWSSAPLATAATPNRG